MDLELGPKEASVGDFSLDLLAKELGTGRAVVIENQLTKTDHDHLGKLLTYAAGFSASVVIWVVESIREEHRQALEWLNQRTDTDTSFFGVVIEALQIDNSNPAFNFKVVVSPNEWQKNQRRQVVGRVSNRGESYRKYFQLLIDELRDKHRFTGARKGQPQNWYSFSSGVSGIHFNAVFAGNNLVRVELYIDQGDIEKNKSLFNWLQEQKEAVETQCGTALEWERLDERQGCRISVNCSGSIESGAEELDEIRRWQINNLLTFKKVFGPLIKDGVKRLNG